MRRSALATVVAATALLACGGPEEEITDEIPTDKAAMAEAVGSGKADFSLDPCEANRWYGDGACEWFCPKRDPDCKPKPIGPDPAGRAAKYPVVLVHGFMMSPALVFQDVSEALRRDGHRVYVPEVPPFQGVAQRGRALAAAIDRILAETRAGKVNLVAHSMGGLDVRYVVSSLKYGAKVASISTIASPHRGSYVADLALNLVGGNAGPALDAVAKLIGSTYSGSASESDLRTALGDLAEQRATAFNKANVNDARVYYQSWAGVSNVHGVANPKDMQVCAGKWLGNDPTRDLMAPGLHAIAAFVARGRQLVPNDGMASVASSKWGVFRGCLPADHADQVGMWGTYPDKLTGWDHLRFYRNLAFELAKKGY